ncbi:deoxyribodipyrimidine photolyase [Aureimonas sp. Leaf454]|uniref:cryptochrome/photolyase family protein n=1 Tax=Aureimonas sp. Leaf454 TaxID=1736381 RepID=UPI0006FE64CA|nr:deoxyribodipyrimidine photo-lyase [Aureimonas sp. Leaf454]KQT48955.1 deoxyribodipyrimidine photolyase [Aureimonas sp. Leaf454]
MAKTVSATGPGPIVVWLRDDLRLDDNPALAHAAETGQPVIPVFVLEEGGGGRPLGGAHRWWLHHSLEAFRASLRDLGSDLVLKRGDPRTIVPDLVRETGAASLFYNRRYHRPAVETDDAVATALGTIAVESFQANILHDPAAVKTKTGGFYKVYTPFMKTLRGNGEPRDPIDPPASLVAPKGGLPASDDLAAWSLLPTRPDWSGGIARDWQPGEAVARSRFEDFCQSSLRGYDESREIPAEDGTTRMSPRLRFGEVSPYRLWHLAEEAARHNRVPPKAIETFRRELIWRDFNYHVLHHVGAIDRDNINPRFDGFEWQGTKSQLRAWQRGRTGYPIVDAAMRQLWQTGWMHNRMRMIVGSFLTKDLLIDWREGEHWFWDTLVDGDIASNTAQWQWIAGSGADAQPFFRIFNPITQGQKFDARGAYIRRYLPELAELSDKDIHTPWLAGSAALRKAGITLGETYPKPIVDHGEARERALAVYRASRPDPG